MKKTIPVERWKYDDFGIKVSVLVIMQDKNETVQNEKDISSYLDR